MRALLVLSLLVAGCAPGAYTLGAVPAAVAALSPVRDAAQPLGQSPVARVIEVPDPGRPWLPADAPVWSAAPAVESEPRCAAAAPHWLSPPPWHGRPGIAAPAGCIPRL